MQPIITMIYTSFAKWDGFNAPQFIGFKNYMRIFTNSAAAESVKNLLWWSLIAMTIHVAFGVLVAFVLYQIAGAMASVGTKFHYVFFYIFFFLKKVAVF